MKPMLGLVSEGKITEIRGLSASEYEKYRKAAMRLIRFSADQQLFVIVRLNYDDYQNLLKRYFEEYTKNPSMDWFRFERMTLNINRHMLNYLSAVRTFLDHSETNLKKRYGTNSERVRTFKDACSTAYDNCFSYRFLCRLRNYVQHCGMPLGKLMLRSKEVDPRSREISHSFRVEFNRNDLLKNFDSWGSQLTKEIQELPLNFEIGPHVAEMMKCLERINLSLLEDDLPELIQSAEYIEQFITPMKDMLGTPCILRIEDLRDKGEGLNVEIEWLPLHIVEIIKNIKTD